MIIKTLRVFLLILFIGLSSQYSVQVQSEGGRLALGFHGGMNKYWGTFTDNQLWFSGDVFARYNILNFLSIHGGSWYWSVAL